ncbi:hypothetical protein JXA02_04685 [candidate division KSB1 bacterium]|nr:hypothetical protein [candidate division KSB1 bacterium]RQW08684.1 MAG: hypothetical protein EH222_05300 [candidate division KSB1 bacterium]
MPKKIITPGRSIAYLSYAVRSNCALVDKLSAAEAERFEQMSDLYHYLNQDDADSPIEAPADRCGEICFLDGNDAFFIRHLLIASPGRANDARFIRHLNDCHECFQIYSQFFKDYALACEEIERLRRG